MAQFTAFTDRLQHTDPLEMLRVLLVSGCALALILAGRALPF